MNNYEQMLEEMRKQNALAMQQQMQQQIQKSAQQPLIRPDLAGMEKPPEVQKEGWSPNWGNMADTAIAMSAQQEFAPMSVHMGGGPIAPVPVASGYAAPQVGSKGGLLDNILGTDKDTSKIEKMKTLLALAGGGQ